MAQMEAERSGPIIDATEDFLYTGPDRLSFPVCLTCGVYSPFMIYLGNNEKSIRFQPHAERTQLFCTICAPDGNLFREQFPGEQLYRADSILNDRKFLDLLSNYEYSNPYYGQYANVDRIIITENTQLCAAYKTVAKRAVPVSFKMKLLMNLFPAPHRLPNQKYNSFEDLAESMREKYHEICISYMDLSAVAGGTQLLDNFDILIDKTPYEERQVSRTVSLREMESSTSEQPMGVILTARSVAHDDSDREIRAVNDSDDEISSVASGRTRRRRTDDSSTSGSTTSIVPDVQISSSEGMSGTSLQHSSQPQSQSRETQQSQSIEVPSSVNISSQSVSQPVGGGITVGYDSDSGNSSDKSDNRPSIYFKKRHTTRSPPTAHDSQEAGPSNVKRRRVSSRTTELPMNPTPAEVYKQPVGRLPRFFSG